MRRILILCLGCGLSGACVWLMLRRVNLEQVGRSVGTAGLTNLLLAMLLYLLGFIPRGLRWQLMLRDVGRFSASNTTRSVILGYAANNLLPFRFGELVRAATFAKMNGTSRTTTLSSILAERMLDAISLVAIFSLSLATVGNLLVASHLRPILIGAGLLGGAGIVTLVVLGGPGRRLLLRFIAREPRLMAIAEKVFTAMAFLNCRTRLLQVSALSLLIWLWEGLVFVALATTLGAPNPWLTGYFTLCVVNLGILVPSAPGYVGIFQAAAVLAAVSLGQSEAQGLALGLLSHAAQFLPVTLLGIILAWPLWDQLGGWRGLTSFSNHG